MISSIGEILCEKLTSCSDYDLTNVFSENYSVFVFDSNDGLITSDVRPITP